MAFRGFLIRRTDAGEMNAPDLLAPYEKMQKKKKRTPRECSTDATVRSRVQGLKVDLQRGRKLIFPSITTDELKKYI